VQTAIFLLVFVAAPRYGLVAQRRPAEMPASPIGQGIDSEFDAADEPSLMKASSDASRAKVMR
jgi:hypothetical protein